MASENEPFGSIDRIDNLRKELDPKIDCKISYQVFFGILGLLALAIIAVLNNAFSQISAMTVKIDALTERVTVVDTKMNERKN